MTDGTKLSDKWQTDFYGEDRHAVVRKLAYEHWEKRGRPFGSPDVDWFAAEKTLRSHLSILEIDLGQDGNLYR